MFTSNGITFTGVEINSRLAPLQLRPSGDTVLPSDLPGSTLAFLTSSTYRNWSVRDNGDVRLVTPFSLQAAVVQVVTKVGSVEHRIKLHDRSQPDRSRTITLPFYKSGLIYVDQWSAKQMLLLRQQYLTKVPVNTVGRNDAIEEVEAALAELNAAPASIIPHSIYRKSEDGSLVLLTSSPILKGVAPEVSPLSTDVAEVAEHITSRFTDSSLLDVAISATPDAAATPGAAIQAVRDQVRADIQASIAETLVYAYDLSQIKAKDLTRNQVALLQKFAPWMIASPAFVVDYIQSQHGPLTPRVLLALLDSTLSAVEAHSPSQEILPPVLPRSVADIALLVEAGTLNVNKTEAYRALQSIGQFVPNQAIAVTVPASFQGTETVYRTHPLIVSANNTLTFTLDENRGEVVFSNGVTVEYSRPEFLALVPNIPPQSANEIVRLWNQTVAGMNSLLIGSDPGAYVSSGVLELFNILGVYHDRGYFL